MFLNYSEFLNESVKDRLAIARKIVTHEELSKVLNDCEEGVYPWIQVVPTPGAESYVGVAINDGESESEVYETSDPKVALVAIVMKNTGKDEPEAISSILKAPDDFLCYTVFGGTRPMTKKEVANRYNFDFKVPAGEATPYYTSTPITNTYY